MIKIADTEQMFVKIVLVLRWYSLTLICFPNMQDKNRSNVNNIFFVSEVTSSSFLKTSSRVDRSYVLK